MVLSGCEFAAARQAIGDMRIGALISSALLAVSCGGSPTGPNRTASIAVTLPSVPRVAETAQATAVATLNTGDARPLSTGWRSDAPAVAAVTNAGLVTGVANGVATISITSDAVQGTKSLRVVPSYHGQWTGSYMNSRGGWWCRHLVRLAERCYWCAAATPGWLAEPTSKARSSR